MNVAQTVSTAHTPVPPFGYRVPPARPSTDLETDLVDRLRAGDERAYETVVREHGGRLLSVARRMLRNEEDARDAVQDAFLSAFRSLEEFQGTARLSTWLHRIVVNAALMKLRTASRRPEEPIEDLLPRFDDEGRWSDAVSAYESRSDVLLQRRDTRVMVRRCIDALPEAYRTVLLLRDIEDLDTEEAAAALGISPNAVKIRLHRARQALRTLLERELSAEERGH
jgi:RNA polymerase sigma-70 factor, ECF subfamily